MAISRAQELKQLLPGLNALFGGDEYNKLRKSTRRNLHTENSERSFEGRTQVVWIWCGSS